MKEDKPGQFLNTLNKHLKNFALKMCSLKIEMAGILSQLFRKIQDIFPYTVLFSSFLCWIMIKGLKTHQMTFTSLPIYHEFYFIHFFFHFLTLGVGLFGVGFTLRPVTQKVFVIL